MRDQLEAPPPDLERLESLWEAGLKGVFAQYQVAAEPVLALAAALVEVGCGVQRLGEGLATPGDLLLGDLCLARASRLLADLGDQPRQVAFAGVVESVSTSAAASTPLPSVRALLLAAIGSGR
ncbi:MAG: hypothetical protein ACRENM_01670 [Candidatus Dormibacteraceae bacterium]